MRARGRIERIGEAEPALEIWFGERSEQRSVVAADHAEAMVAVGQALAERGQGVHLLKAIGHRVVHGAAIVPEDQVMLLPYMAVDEFRPDAVAVEEIED